MNEIDKTSDQTRSHFILSHILSLLFPNWHAVSVPIAIYFMHKDLPFRYNSFILFVFFFPFNVQLQISILL